MSSIQQSIRLAFNDLSTGRRDLVSPSVINETSIDAFAQALFSQELTPSHVQRLQELNENLEQIAYKQKGSGSADESEPLSKIKALTERALTKRRATEHVRPKRQASAASEKLKTEHVRPKRQAPSIQELRMALNFQQDLPAEIQEEILGSDFSTFFRQGDDADLKNMFQRVVSKLESNEGPLIEEMKNLLKMSDERQNSEILKKILMSFYELLPNQKMSMKELEDMFLQACVSAHQHHLLLDEYLSHLSDLKDEMGLKFLPLLQDDELAVKIAITIDGQELQYAKAFQNRRDIVLAAVREHGGALQYAKTFQGDLEIVLEAVAQGGQFLKHAPAFQNVREVVLVAAAAGEALHYAPAFLGDREVALAAVRFDGLELNLLPAFRNDREVVLAAIANTPNAIQYASPELQIDPEILQAVEATKQRLEYERTTRLINDFASQTSEFGGL